MLLIPKIMSGLILLRALQFIKHVDESELISELAILWHQPAQKCSIVCAGRI